MSSNSYSDIFTSERPVGFGTSRLVRKLRFLPKRLISQLVREGIDFIDTAQLYGNTGAELILGEMSPVIQDIPLVTKIGIPFEGMPIPSSSKYITADQLHLPREQSWSSFFPPESLQSLVKQSCFRLRRDKIDVFLLHSVTSDLHLEPYIEALNTLKNEGVILSAGVSIDEEINSNLDWADVIQMPATIATGYYFQSQKYIVNQIFTQHNKDLSSVSLFVKSLPQHVGAVVGSRNINHIKWALSNFKDEVND